MKKKIIFKYKYEQTSVRVIERRFHSRSNGYTTRFQTRERFRELVRHATGFFFKRIRLFIWN